MKKNKKNQNWLRLLLIAVLISILCISFGDKKVLAQSTPTVNGLFYGDGDNTRYHLLSSNPGRGYLYYYQNGTTYYFAVVIDAAYINDNVFGNMQDANDQAYVQTAGWKGLGNQHHADALIKSEHMEIVISCDEYSWTWKQDYADDADKDMDPTESDWFSSHTGADGAGTPPPGYTSSSSFVYNMNNSTWDVTLSGARTTATTWKSVDGDNDNDVSDEGWPTYNSTYDWEWPVVYEFSVDLSQCAGIPRIKIISAHNSPPKTGSDPDVPIPPDGDVPVAIELSSFSVACVGGAVQLQWTTQTETENMGYHVYRSKAEDGQYTKITRELILAAGNSVQAHSYTYMDRDVEYGNTYYYKLADVDYSGNLRFHGPISVTVEAVPANYSLSQNYPNPFNPETAINFSIKEAGKVTLQIYNLQGQLVRTLVDEEKMAGSYAVMWNGTNDFGIRLASGIYYYTLKVNGFEETRKLTLMK